jgi:hypothetical protein
MEMLRSVGRTSQKPPAQGAKEEATVPGGPGEVQLRAGEGWGRD